MQKENNENKSSGAQRPTFSSRVNVGRNHVRVRHCRLNFFLFSLCKNTSQRWPPAGHHASSRGENEVRRSAGWVSQPVAIYSNPVITKNVERCSDARRRRRCITLRAGIKGFSLVFPPYLLISIFCAVAAEFRKTCAVSDRFCCTHPAKIGARRCLSRRRAFYILKFLVPFAKGGLQTETLLRRDIFATGDRGYIAGRLVTPRFQYLCFLAIIAAGF